MGVVDGVGMYQWPEQGAWVGKRVDVCFGYDTSQTIGGTIVRDDLESPYLMIIRLDDGRHVLATECQHSMPRAEGTKDT